MWAQEPKSTQPLNSTQPAKSAQPAKSLPLADVLARVRTARNATDFRAGGRLVRVTAAAERKVYQISLKAHAFVDQLKTLCEVTDPPVARERLLIESNSAGRGRILEGRAGEAAAKELAPAQWGDALLGSDFSYEDLLESQLLWKKQALVETAPCGARNCYVIKSEPAAEDRSQYSAVTTWLDRDIYYPVRIEKDPENRRDGEGAGPITICGKPKGVWGRQPD